ncbi:MAG: serine/threonine-protein kinase [Gammaproteobacteria bacterium]|nr:serine/threonine-protein kinase [Gammaproteobacteria bacterium]
MTEGIPSRLGKYEVLDEIARGGMGIVFLGYDSFVDREVAIKVQHNDSVVGGDRAARNRKMFFNEAHTAGRLHHPNILSIFDAGVEGDICYIVMELIQDGNTLKPFCKPESLLPVDKVIEIVFKCAKALDYAHRNGVVHRDIKPGNILVTPDMDVKVGDFSIALFTEGDMSVTQPLGVMGSPLYMSPEQINDLEVDSRTDLFSLGVILYELLTGRHPFASDKISTLLNKVINDEPAKLRFFRNELPADLELVIERALAKDPDKRFQSGLEFAAELSTVGDLGEAEDDLYNQERYNAVRQLDFFQDFADTEIWEILRATVWQDYQPGEEIITEGEIDDAFYVIVTGSVLVRKGTKSIAILRRGDCFGEMGYITKTKRTATILVTSLVSIMKINATLIEQLSKDTQLRFHRVFLRTLVDRLSRASDKLSE